MSNTNSQRRQYVDTIAMLQKSGITTNVSQSTLRLEAVLNSTQTTFKFAVKNNEGVVKATEKRLNPLDVFTVSEMGIFIGLASASDSTDFVIKPFVDSAIFTDANVRQALEKVYNGFLKLTVNNAIRIDGWDVMKHKNWPNSEELDYAKCGFAPLTPQFVLAGNNTSDLEISIPSAISQLPATGEVRLVLILRGYLAQQAAK